MDTPNIAIPNIASPNIDTPVVDTNIDTTTATIPSAGIFDNPQSFTDIGTPDLNTAFENPFTAGRAAPPPSNEDPLARMLDAQLRKGPSFEAQTAPGFFDWEGSNADRFINSPYYQELGFNPNRDNETLFGNHQTWGNTLSNAFAGGANLAWNTFVDGWKGWGRMVNALTSWDATKLMGSSEELDALNKEQNRIMDKYAIFKTPESQGSIFNRQFLGDMIQQSGFAVGTLAQFASEELLTMGASTLFRGIKEAGTMARIAQGLTTEEIMADIKRIGDEAWKGATASKLYKGLKFIGEYTPVAGNLVDAGLDIWKASKYGTNVWEVGGITLNGLRRTMAEANMAFTESRMEAAGTYGDLKTQLYDDTIKKKGDVSYEDQQRIEKMAQGAAWSNFRTNAAVISIMNRIEFDNLFHKFGADKSVAREVAEAGEGLAEKINKVSGTAAKDIAGEAGQTAIKAGQPLTQVYEKGVLGTFGNLGKISADFGKQTAAWEATKSLGRNLFKWEVAEGAQELIQEGSNTAIKDYYTDLYTSSKTDARRSIGKAIDSLTNVNGLKIFLMGAVTGRLLAPITRGVSFAADRILTDKDERAAADTNLRGAISDVNTYFRDPMRYSREAVSNLKSKSDLDAEDFSQRSAPYYSDQNVDPNAAKTADFVQAFHAAPNAKEAERIFQEYHSSPNKEQAENVLQNYYSDPSRFAPESVANLKVQNTAAQIMEDAVKNNDQYTYEHAKDGAFAKAVTAAKKLNMLTSLTDTMRAYGDHFNEQEFHEAYAVDFNDSTRKPGDSTRNTVKQYMNKLADEVEAFSNRYDHLRETYADLIQPERYREGPDRDKALLAKRSLDEAVEWIATNEYRAKRTAERRLSILDAASALPTVGKSAFSALRILGDDNVLQDEVNLLGQEIASMEGANAQDRNSKQLLQQKKQQHAALEKLKGNVSLFEEDKGTEGQLSYKVEGNKVTFEPLDTDSIMDALGDYMNAKNKESGIDMTVSSKDLDDLYFQLRDYRRLHRDGQKFMDAYSLLANPKKFRGLYIRIQQGLKHLSEEQKKQAQIAPAPTAETATTSNVNAGDQQEKELAAKVGDDIDNYYGFQVNDKISYQQGSSEKGPFNIERISTTRVELFNSNTNTKESMSLDRFDGLIQENKVKRLSSEEHFGENLQGGKTLIDKKEGVYMVEVAQNGSTYYVLTDSKEKVLNEEGGFIGENEPQVTYKDKTLAQEARNNILSLRAEQQKEDMQPYTFDGKEIKLNDILIKDGQRYKVMTSKEPEIQDDKPVINLQQLGSKDITTVDSLKDYEHATEVAATRAKARKAQANKFKLKVPDIISGVRGIIKEGETQEAADKRLQEIIRSVTPEDFLKNLVIRLTRNRNWKKGNEATHSENQNLQVRGSELDVQLLYKNEPIGTIPNYKYYQYLDDNGKPVELSNLTKEQFQQIFDVAPGDAAQQLKVVQNNYKQAKSTFSEFFKQTLDKGNVDLDTKAIHNFFQLTLFSGDYDWAAKPSVPLKNLKYNGVGGKVVLLMRQLERGVRDKLARKENLVTEETLTDAQKEALLKQINKYRKPNGIDITQNMGDYLAVVELPNKELRFVPLLTPIYEEKELNELVQQINDQSKLTKETNIKEAETKKKKAVAKDDAFNNDFNATLAEKLMITVSPTLEVNISLNPTGNLALTFFNTEKNSNATITLEGKDAKSPLAYTDFKELLTRINEKIAERDAKQSDPQQRIDIELTADDFRKHLSTQPDFAEIKNLLTPVTEQVVNGGSIKVNYNTKTNEVLDIQAPDTTIPISTHKGINGQKEVEAGVIENTKPTAEQSPVTETTTSTASQTEPATATPAKPQPESRTSSTVTTQPTATTKTQPVATNAPLATPASEAGNKVDELKRLEEELIKAKDSAFDKYKASGMSSKEAMAATKKDAEVVDLTARINKLNEEIKKEAKAYKVVASKLLSKGAVENIERFRDWVKTKLPAFITVQEADLIRENMLKEGVTVGQFVYSLKTLSETKKAAIRVDPQAPYKYHEAFHAVFRLLLTDLQIEKYLDIAKKEVKELLVKNKTTLQKEVSAMRELTPEYYEGLSEPEMEKRYYEEYLADRFDAWKTDYTIKTDPVNKNLFRRILDWIKNFIKPNTPGDLEGLFYEINAGKFRDASLAVNQFTNAKLVEGNTEVVPKAIKIGELWAKNEDGEAIKINQYLPEEKGSALAAAIAATFHQRMEKAGENKNADQILDGIFNDYANLYDKENDQYFRYLEDKDTRQQYFRMEPELDKLKAVFTTGREALKEAVEKHFQSIEYLYNEEAAAEEDVLDELGDQATQDYKKSKESFGGFGSLPKWLRQYIATTTYQAEDTYGNKYLKEGESLLQAVDTNMVYSGILKAVAGFDDIHKMLLRMKEFARYNNQSAHFIERFFNDMGIELTDTGYNVLKEEMLHKFNMVMKSFQQYTPNYLLFSKNLTTHNSFITQANRRAAAGYQLSIWYNAYSQRFEHRYLQIADSKKAEFLNDSISGLELFRSLANSQPIGDAKLEKNALQVSNDLKEKLGLSFHPLFIQYSLICARTTKNQTEAQRALVKAFGDIQSMKREDAKELLNTIRSGKNPFVWDTDIRAAEAKVARDNERGNKEEEEEDGMQLIELANSNAIFDETVNTTSFRNAEGELVYAHQLPTYHLAKIKELSTILPKGAPVGDALSELLKDPFMADHFLMNSDDFRSMAADLRVSRIEGMNSYSDASKRKGVTYGQFTAREMMVSLFELFGVNQKYEGETGPFYSSQHLVRVIESTNTGDTVNLPVIQAVESNPFDGIQLSQPAVDALTAEVRKEFERIGRVKEEIAQIEAEQLALEQHGTPRTLKEVDDYHNTKGSIDPLAKPRGLTLFKTAGMLGTLAEELERAAQQETPKFNNYTKRIEQQLQEYWTGDNGKVKQLMDLLKDMDIIRDQKDESKGGFVNVLLPGFMSDGFMRPYEQGSDENKNEAMNLKPGDLEHNIAQVMINDFINTASFNQLLLGDQALSLKDFVDMVKRAKGANGSGPSIAFDVTAPSLGIHHAGRNSHLVQIDDAKFYGIYANKMKDKADAQMWMTLKSLRYTLFGLGKLTPKMARLLNKIERGEKVNVEEIFGKNGTISYDGQTNSIKMVYYDGTRYIKTSGFLLTKELTSIKDDKGDWRSRDGWEELHALRTKLEEYEDRNETICMAVPKSASKGEKANTARGILPFIRVKEDGSKEQVEQITDWNFQQLDNRYWRLQTVNLSNKMIITDPTQAKQLIMAEQNDGLKVEFMWDKYGAPTATNMTVGDLKQLYREQTAQRVKVKYRQARNELFNLEGTLQEINDSIKAGKVTPKLARFQQRAIEVLRTTGADSQLLEFFTPDDNGQGKYDLNHPVTLDKFTQLFMAYFSKEVMNEKIPGHAITLVSAHGARLVKEVLEVDDNGQPKRWRVVRRAEYEDNPGAYKNAVQWEEDPANTYQNDEERRKNAAQFRLFRTLKDQFEANKKDGKKTYILDDLRHNVPVYKLNSEGEIMKDKNGNDIILDRYTEYMMAPHTAEAMRLMNETGELPDVLSQGFGVRIPSQDKHSFVNLRLVDFLPAHYGSSGIFAPELIEISGADYDVDNVYVSIKDHYTRKKNGKTEFIEYGRTNDEEEQYNEFLHYQKRSNKRFQQRYKELLAEHPSYNDLKEKVLALKNLIQPFKEAVNRRPSYYKEQQEEFWTKHSVNILFDEIFGMDTLGAETTANLSELMTTLDRKTFLDELKQIENKGDVSLKEWYDNYNYLSSLVKQIDDHITTKTLREFSMPETVKDYQKKVKEEGEQNIGKLNNTILDAKMKLQGNEDMVKWNGTQPPIAYEVASVEPLEKVLDYLKEEFPVLKKTLEEGNEDVDSILGKVVAYRNNKEGAQNIGPAVNAMLAFTLLNTFKVDLREKNSYNKPIWRFNLNGVDFDTYGKDRAYSGKDEKGKPLFEGDRILHNLSAIVSAMTDNAKERLAAKLGLNIEAVGLVSNLVAQGVPMQSAITFIMQPIIQEYYKRTSNLRAGLKTEEEGVGPYAVGEQMQQELKEKMGNEIKEVNLTDDILKENILTKGDDLNYQYSVLQSFLNLKEQTAYFNTVSGIMKLAKGMGTSHEDSIDMQQKINKLMLREDDEVFKKTNIPFDLRQVMTGANKEEEHHEIMASYLDIFDEINDLSKVMFLERTDHFNHIADIIKNNLRIRKFEARDFHKRFKRDLISYLSIKAYQKMLLDKGLLKRFVSLDNAMIHDVEAEKMPEDFKDIVDVVRDVRERLPDNYFVNQFLNALPTTIADGKGGMEGNPYNSTGINKVEVNTWAKLNQLQIEKLQDSFLDIYQNDDTRPYAWALFHYLLVKDGGQFRNGSFIRYIPNFMFKDITDATNRINQLMATKPDEKLYQQTFGMGSEELLNEFARGYLLNVNNRNHIANIDLSLTAPKKIEVAPFGEQEKTKEGAEDYVPKTVLFHKDGTLEIDLDRGVREQKQLTGPAKLEDIIENKARNFKKMTEPEKARLDKNMKDLNNRGFWKSVETVTRKKGPAREVSAIRFPYVIRGKVERDNISKTVYYVLTELDGNRQDPKNPTAFLGEDNLFATGRTARYMPQDKLEGNPSQWGGAFVFGKLSPPSEHLRQRTPIINNGGFSLEEQRKLSPSIENTLKKELNVYEASDVLYDFQDQYKIQVSYSKDKGLVFERDGQEVPDQKKMKETYFEFAQNYSKTMGQIQSENADEDFETEDEKELNERLADEEEGEYDYSDGPEADFADGTTIRDADSEELLQRMKEGPLGKCQ
jgi:hypothetical protein